MAKSPWAGEVPDKKASAPDRKVMFADLGHDLAVECGIRITKRLMEVDGTAEDLFFMSVAVASRLIYGAAALHGLPIFSAENYAAARAEVNSVFDELEQNWVKPT